jgi:hypothetical protein
MRVDKMEYELCGVVMGVSNSSDGFSTDGDRDASDCETGEGQRLYEVCVFLDFATVSVPVFV